MGLFQDIKSAFQDVGTILVGEAEFPAATQKKFLENIATNEDLIEQTARLSREQRDKLFSQSTVSLGGFSFAADAPQIQEFRKLVESRVSERGQSARPLRATPASLQQQLGQRQSKLFQ